jgi:hypothetical protein
LLGEFELPVDGAGDASLERADGVAGAVALGATPPVVGLAWTGQAKLGDGNAVECSIQLPVAAPTQPVAVGPSRADRDRRDPGVHGKQASERKRVTPAVSAMSLAAVSGPQPGRLSRLGASRATRWRSSPVSWSMRAVSAPIATVNSWQMAT